MVKEYGFYKDAERGDVIQKEDCLRLIRQYRRVIIWGSGNLGSTLGKCLIEHGIMIDAYWDARYETVKECNGVPVREPLKDIGSKEGLLVVFCITNAFVIPRLYQILAEENIQNMEGVYDYQALLCPVSVDNSDIRECYSRKECNIATCKRQNNVMSRTYDKKEKVLINTLDVYLTQKCSLACKYCYIYTNSYPQEKRIHFDTEQILRNVDVICEAASYVKRMVPFGGEPFLHPEIEVIVEKMASKKNVGTIEVISNGIFSKSDKVLQRLKFDNVRISVSNYNNALPENLIKIRENNIERLQQLGLNVIVHNDTPQWRKPGILGDNGLNKEQLIQKKGRCANFRNIGTMERDSAETLVIKAGRLYACQHCDTMYSLGVVQDTEDSVNLDKRRTSEELAKKIKDLLHKEYYQACRFCHPSIELVENAGEQGMDEIYKIDGGKSYDK